MSGPNIDDALAAIKTVKYVVLPDGRTTVCQLVMDNGFTVTGQSVCAPSTEFNQSRGEAYAFEQARDRVLELVHFRAADQRLAARTGQ
ncbi:MAG: Gp49 family protein [Lysobacter sp.]